MTMFDSDGPGMIVRTEMGLGRSRRDTHLQDYEDALDHKSVNLTYKIPDGIPAWVKIRVTDKGTEKGVCIGTAFLLFIADIMW